MVEQVLYRAFSNIGFAGNGRAFPGFPPKSETTRRALAPREAARFDVAPGDLLAATPLGRGQSVTLFVVDDAGRPRPEALGLTANAQINSADFEGAPLWGWWIGCGGAFAQTLPAATISLDELQAFKAREACVVWAIRPVDAADLVSAASCGLIEVALKSARVGGGVALPPPLGEIREEFTVPRGSARAYDVRPGEIVQIIDVEGQQCSDFVALRRAALDVGLERMIDSTATRSMVRGAYPGPGLFNKFYDRDLKPMMRVMQDTCGRHDAFGMACAARSYEERGFPGHLNCSDNISHALAPHGAAARPAWAAINFFWNTWVDAHSHRLMTEESHSRPGDYVALQALDTLVCVTTACPDDLDPINGWNPTDVHVRIYRPDAPIRRAVAYREKEDAPMSISRESAFHPAISKLAPQFAPTRDIWTPTTFPSVGVIGEYWACRERATLQDMSGVRKFDIVGPDAERLLQRVLTRDISRLAVWRGLYALMCDEAGSVIDDGALFRLGPELFRWCCGSEESARALQSVADAEGLQARIQGLGGALPNLALQGPRARDILRQIVYTAPTTPSLEQLKWFGVTVARLGDRDGVPFMLSRSGYTGELGYELFCASRDAPALWDAVMAAGEAFGVAPMGSAALEILRIEAGLAAAGAEFAPGVDAYEAGLGFAVTLDKPDFIGKAALERNACAPRRKLRGLMFDGDDAPAHGAHVFAGERPVGVIASATRSPMFRRAVATARLAVEFSETGQTLEVGQMDGRMKRLSATVCDLPFFDPKRERAKA